ncbi:MAG: GNAT family N-acetyltransferase [Oscillospiraceae bacterium]|nr:GNAT family N-acetyltransferase [Oscillospiraceae bacterium]
MLLFAGRGSAFAEEHNSAFFIRNQELVLLDCPISAFQKYKTLDFRHIRHIYILVTHTHGDHAGGIGSMIQYAWFVLNHLPVTVVAPSETVKNDLNTLLMQIEGCKDFWFELTTAKQLLKDWLIEAIPTEHALTLKEKCFGYYLHLDGRNIIYTGDTAILRPFLPYLKKGSILYTECSYYWSDVHLHLPQILPDLLALTEKGIRVYLMHLDNEKEILKLIQGTKLRLAPLYPFRKQIPVRLIRMKISDIQKAKILYEDAFPDDEKAPFPLLLVKQYLADVDFLSIYAGKQWAGFFYLVNHQNLSYIFYFAVRPELREKGIGSQALQRLQKFCQGRKLFLAIEPLDEHVTNYEERVSRKHFYLKNGFQELHRHVQEADVIYELLGIGGDVLPEEYQKLIGSFTGKILYRSIPMRILD